MERRKFLGNVISFSALIAFHFEAQALSSNLKSAKQIKSCRFKSITLYTSQLDNQFEFYSMVLGLPILNKSKTHFTIKIGDSTLQFKEVKDGSEPFYHYAINIPSNKYLEAKKWLAKKTPLLINAYSGEDLLYFDFWDAHAMYFKDPAGNIGELIARHTLSNDSDGEFGISDLLCISEIGTPVDDPNDMAKELRAAYGLEMFGSEMFIGDEMGLFVIVPIDRLWFPENIQEAAVYPTDILINDKGVKEFQYQNYPYHIKYKS